jgi:hypothetical protein
VRIPRGDEAVLRQRQQAEGSPEPGERVDQAFLDGLLAGTRQEVQHHFAVRGGAEDGSAPFQLAANRRGVHDVAVVRDRHGAAVGVHADRVRVPELGLPGRGIADVTDRVTPRKSVDDVLVEDLGNEAHRTVRKVLPAVRAADPGALLTPMLECVEAQVRDLRRLGVTVYADDPAFVLGALLPPSLGQGDEFRRVGVHVGSLASS